MKRKYGYIGMAVIVLIFGIIVLPEIMKRISNNDIARDEHSVNGGPNSDRKMIENPTNFEKPASDGKLAYIKRDGEKRKTPDFSFTDQNGKTITNEDYKGKVYLVEFFFTTCPTICPKMNAQMTKIEDDFLDQKDFGIASFSINPEHDTPQVLKEYAKEYNVKDPDWHLMTGDRDKIFKLANQGFNIYAAVNKNVPGNFQHQGYFALIDREGYLRSSRDKFGNPILFYNALDESEMQLLRKDIKKLL